MLLWLELKKLAFAGVRLTAGVFLVLAILNVGLGAGALVDSQPFNLEAASSQFETTELLHLQFFGFFHVHQNLAAEHSQAGSSQTSPAAGVSEFEDGVINQPSAYTHFSYLNHFTRFGSSDYGSRAGQKILTDFQDPHNLVGITALVALSQAWITDDNPVTDPFLKTPLKPPIF